MDESRNFWRIYVEKIGRGVAEIFDFRIVLSKSRPSNNFLIDPCWKEIVKKKLYLNEKAILVP